VKGEDSVKLIRRGSGITHTFGRDHLNAVSTPQKNIAMSKIVAIMSMSLDGYVADLNDGVAEVFDWYVTSGDVEIHTGGSDPLNVMG